MTATRSRRYSTTETLMGEQEPSERVVPDYDDTDGADAERILRVGNLVLDPWQSQALRDWMAVTRWGRWVCGTCAGSVPRQNGKSGLVEGRAMAGMIMYNEQVIYTAHLQKTATETFEEMAAFFEAPKLKRYVKDIKTALGREQIILTSGARVKFLARTRNGGRGQHGDLLIFDEAQELDENAQASFIPAISASINPQTIYVGTPPDPTASGTVFRTIRDKALSGKSSSTAYFEFGVKEIGDVTDQSRWAQTNPALGRRIQLSTIKNESEQMPPDTFARERLGWWMPVRTEQDDKALDKAAWIACGSSELKPDGKTAYGVKITADGAAVALCGAVIGPDGVTRISLIDYRSTAHGLAWLAQWLRERYGKASCVVLDGRGGVDVIIDKIGDVWRVKGSIVRAGARDVVAAAGMLVDAVSAKELTWYDKQDTLNASALGAIKRPIGGGWGFGGDESAPIEAAALALWGVKTTKRDPNKKMRIG